MEQKVGENIRYHRERKGVSQNQAAFDTDIPQSLWWAYENGYHSPSLKTLEKICEYLGVTSDDILGF